MHRGNRSAHPPIAFVGYDAERTGLDHPKVDPRDTNVSSEKDLTQNTAGGIGQDRYIFGIRDAKFFMEELAHLPAPQMDSRSDDMAGVLTAQLDDIFTKVGLNGAQASRFKFVVEIDFLRHH